MALKPDEEWMAEDDLRTLMRAREIRNDPKRMARVKALATKRIAEVARLAGDGDKD
jgi:hypothetical protein